MALKPDETTLVAARFQGRRVPELAAQSIDGRMPSMQQVGSSNSTFRGNQSRRGEWKCNA
jgi:hypothetical protein